MLCGGVAVIAHCLHQGLHFSHPSGVACNTVGSSTCSTCTESCMLLAGERINAALQQLIILEQQYS